MNIHSLSLFFLTGLCILFCTPQTITAAPSTREIAAMEKKLIALVNAERIKHKLSPLSEWDVLSFYAKEHSKNMADGRVKFGHDGFHERARAVGQNISLKSCGENVAYCYLHKDPLKIAVIKWMESPGHRDNILGDYEMTGIAIVCDAKGGFYMTQLFAKRF